MRFDLKTFLREGRTPYHKIFTLDLSSEDFPGYQVTQPVCGTFTADPIAGGAALQCSFTAMVEAECARCLAPIQRQFTLDRFWQVRERDLASPEFELPLDEKGGLDLAQLVFEELVLEVPPVLLCSLDCEGLCPVCGKRKADGCTCVQPEEKAPVDERLAILKQLLN